MPEGAHPYPRWEGPLRTGPLFMVVAGQEIRRAFNNFWSRLVLTFVVAYTIVYVGGLWQNSQSASVALVHTVPAFVEFLDQMRWGSLAVAAVMAGPSLLEDARKGGLELYLSRAVSKRDYLTGKILAVFGLASLAMVLPGILYWLSAGLLFRQHPEGWGLALGGSMVYGLLWGLMVSGLGMGLSAVARSSRAATLILLGTFVALHVFISVLLQPITRNQQLQILSPFSMMEAPVSYTHLTLPTNREV